MKQNRLRSFGLGLSFLAAAASIPLACSPDSGIKPGGSGAGASGGGISSSSGMGAGGEGGTLFLDSGGTCGDPTDKDKDLIADFLELAPNQDTDDDGTPDALDNDSDGDGVLDADEAANPFLLNGEPGQTRDDSCDPLADSDGDGDPDVRDLDSDNDGVSDTQETTYDADGAKGCRVRVDCDDDGVIDLVELAAGSSPTEKGSVPADAGLYFVLPYQGGPQTKDFTFSTGVTKADIYFLIDTTASMQPAIDNLKASIDTEIIPAILNGDPAASPPIPAIGDAWIGVGEVRDVPWLPYGQDGDALYRYRFQVGAQTIAGDLAPPVFNGQTYTAPVATKQILGTLTAGGGGDAPEGTSQALWLAATNPNNYALTIGGIWNYPQHACPLMGGIGAPCFRPESLPIFVLITDAAFHNGPNVTHQYDGAKVGGTVKTYADAVTALNNINAKVVGVPVATGSPGAARADLTDLATQTGSLYHDPAFGGKDYPLVPKTDVGSGSVSQEVVRLLGRLADAGLHDVTTAHENYACDGGVDCTGDGVPDLAYQNPPVDQGMAPFDASTLITKIETLESAASPLPYASRTESTFFGLQGDAPVSFRVHAVNNTIKPATLLVMRALIRVRTPDGQVLGGKNGIKLVYFVIPQYIPKVK
ncbi:hypothetical protein [Polyangium fumosum]|uniref:VWA domain-containing protein n=1 Tax=Polyangium fumosum TaxID=889272 RepID=A0A4U1IS14_9BACT|nr:hypothetical protein [Polyangium fumosum]TKC97037.1 hypothetical protein E8A74_44850 [Polyangium fumosum]